MKPYICRFNAWNTPSTFFYLTYKGPENGIQDGEAEPENR
jgi:hypothetical protein